MTVAATESGAFELAAAIRAGETTARDVLEAHLEVLARVNPVVNAVVVPRIEQARADADAADALLAKDPSQAGPLHGVPVTIKESIAVAGMPNAAGVVARAEHRAETTATAAQRLLDAGAILIGLTNTSELCMWIESENRLYGRTRNAYDPSRIAGGSSGGEGAAVGAGMSALGLGSDIGGSIRIPAFCNGVFGHKPSLGLIPTTGAWPPVTGAAGWMMANGPLTRRAEDLAPALRLLAGPDGQDSYATAMEVGEPADVALDGLRVVLSEQAFIQRVSPELRRAREHAAEALARAGARVERAALRDLRRALEIHLTMLSHDVGVTSAEIFASAGSPPLRLRGGLRRGGPHTVATRLMLAAEPIAHLTPKRRATRLVAAGRAFRDELAATIGDGVLLHPPLAAVAPRHGRTVGRPWWIHPMAIFNLGAVPVTQVPLGLNASGLPLGVQVAAGPGRDHVSIAVALELERAFGGWVPPPRAATTIAIAA